MAALLKQSTAVTVTIGPFLDKTDGVTEETALGTPSVELSKAGGAFAAASTGTTAHLAEGWYDCDLDATDTNTLGRLVLKSHDSATHLPVWHEFQVVPAHVYDGLVAGTDTLQVDAVQIEGADATDQIRDAVVDDATRIDASALNVLSGHAPASTIAAASDVPSAPTVADAVWDEARAGHVAAGSFGEGVSSVQGGVTGAVGSVTGNVGGNVTGSVGSVAAGGITAASVATGAIDADALAADAATEIAAAVLAAAVEGSLTMAEIQRILLAFAAGKASGGGSTPIAFRDQADTKDRISMAVDSSGNRSSTTVDGS